jgi:hypothetical protein
MRIISKFKDYYDIVAGQGVDLTRVFTRSTTEFKGNFPLPEWDQKRAWRRESNILRSVKEFTALRIGVVALKAMT